MPSRKVIRDTAAGPVTEWLASFNHNGKRQRKRGFATKKEAEKWILAETNRLDAKAIGKASANQTRTVTLFLREWIDVVEKGLHGRAPVERSTLQGYKTVIEKHLIPVLGDETLADVQAPEIVKARKTLLETRTRQIAQRSLRFLRMALNYAIEVGYIQHNPAATVSVKKAARDRERVKMPSREEMTALLEATATKAEAEPEKHLRFATLLIVLQGTGMRISEARGLTWGAIDLQAQVLRITQRADQFNKLGRPKSRAATRTVLLDDEVVAWLQRWKQYCPKGELDLVFPNSLGKVEGYANLYHREWVPLCTTLKLVDEKGLPIFAFHASRHYRVSELINHGFNIKLIGDQVGHASSTITHDVYGHLFDDDTSTQHTRLKTIPTARRKVTSE